MPFFISQYQKLGGVILLASRRIVTSFYLGQLSSLSE